LASMNEAKSLNRSAFDFLSDVANASRLPVQAVGGIRLEDLPRLPSLGVRLVVVGARLVISSEEFAPAADLVTLEKILRQLVEMVNAPAAGSFGESRKKQKPGADLAMNELAGKIVLVAGSTSGLGAGIGRLLLSQGGSVMLHGRDTNRAEALIRSLVASGICNDHMSFCRADLVDADECGCAHMFWSHPGAAEHPPVGAENPI